MAGFCWRYYFDLDCYASSFYECNCSKKQKDFCETKLEKLKYNLSINKDVDWEKTLYFSNNGKNLNFFEEIVIPIIWILYIIIERILIKNMLKIVNFINNLVISKKEEGIPQNI